MSTAAPAAASAASAGAKVAAELPGYRRFVRPGHPLVRRLLGPPPSRAAGAVETAEAVLETARRRLRYDPAPGRHDFDRLLSRIAPPDGGAAILNCIDAVCVLASHLRAGGFGADEVWVVLGGLSSPTGVDRGAEFHAWLAVLLDDGELLWVDPATLAPERRRAEEVLAEHRLYAIFNDRRVHFLDDDKRRLLTSGRRGNVRLFLFGRSDPELASAIADPAFHRLVAELAANGFADPPAADATSCERWRAAGLLATDDGLLTAGEKLLVVPRAAEEEAFALTAPHVERYREIVAAAVPALRDAYAATATARRWTWPQVSSAVVAGMLLDLAVGREFGILARVRRGCGENVVWAFEHVSADQGIGVVWAESPDGDWGVGQLWHRAVERRPVCLTPAMVELAGRLALGEPPPPASPELLFLRHHWLVARSGDGFDVTWPTFAPADAAKLSAPLADAGRRLFDEAVLPAVRQLTGRPWWRRGRDDDSYHHAALRLMLDYGCQRVYGCGLVEPAPDREAPPSWGRWLWLGRRGDALPRDLDAVAERKEVSP